MRYIRNTNEVGRFAFDSYRSYLKSKQKDFPPHVYAFASDLKYHDDSPSSLHDSWLQHAVISEVECEESRRRTDIELVFLGSQADREIVLAYTDVSRYVFVYPDRPNEPRYQTVVGHGDCLTHEIILWDNNTLVHEFLFEREASFVIECKDIRHSERMRTDLTKSKDADAKK